MNTILDLLRRYAAHDRVAYALLLARIVLLRPRDTVTCWRLLRGYGASRRTAVRAVLRRLNVTCWRAFDWNRKFSFLSPTL